MALFQYNDEAAVFTPLADSDLVVDVVVRFSIDGDGQQGEENMAFNCCFLMHLFTLNFPRTALNLSPPIIYS
jgi:hypothetical protein